MDLDNDNMYVEVEENEYEIPEQEEENEKIFDENKKEDIEITDIDDIGNC